jgi:hypothetical protein
MSYFVEQVVCVEKGGEGTYKSQRHTEVVAMRKQHLYLPSRWVGRIRRAHTRTHAHTHKT